MRKLFILLMGICMGFIAGWSVEHNRCKAIIMDKIKRADKFYTSYQIFVAWLKLYERKIRADAYLKWAGYEKIAIYGNGQIGRSLLKDLEGTDIEVCYFIDKKAEKMAEKIPVLSLKEELPKVDVIVVTVVNDFHSIKNELESKCDYNIVPIEDVIFGSSEY